MAFADNPIFDYNREPSRDILCIDCKSFYASTESVARGWDPMAADLVVMSYPQGGDQGRGSGLIMAASPQAKANYQISNISRARDLPYPYPASLMTVPPRMRFYMAENQAVNRIYKGFVDEDNHHVYSVDESFLDVTNTRHLFGAKTADEMAAKIQAKIKDELGLRVTVGIGDNPLLAKLALDNAAKHQQSMRAEWRYEDVPDTLWQIKDMTDFWGIGRRTAKSLQGMGINNIYDLAHNSYYMLRDKLGIVGGQLYAHAWGIDRSFIGQPYQVKTPSLGNSQILPRDYNDYDELAVVVGEMADQVASRLRRAGLKAGALSLYLGFSLAYQGQGRGLKQRRRILASNQSRHLKKEVLNMLADIYQAVSIRQVGVTASHLSPDTGYQVNLFEDLERQAKNQDLDLIVDKVRYKYGFTALVRASSLSAGGRAIARSSLVGGHAGGMAGIEGSQYG
ncbi:excinuclease ABC subunit A [Aerococcus urinaehominis]|uniref:Excinuclease ABC subunit A n=1 Tax=Aerococcus urinaehominis TaxID=128944 RepID=A0A0X8FKD8_9LACT|nr:Y-family DNA polymerase [Aerococcus urinaehominis]AMB98943.1 excinuclease ABC subunit A [Aerococcus urinaehominis]SDM40639.1 DNA polymerase V [Aerococcus urinaehominis]